MDPFVGEIRLFAGNFAPKGWAACNGQLLPIAQNTALFSLLGTTYGGNGTSNFALPDFRDRVPMHYGQGPGLSAHLIGEYGGEAQVALVTAQLPAHQHSIGVSSADATDATAGAQLSLARANANAYGTAANLGPMASPAGGNVAHENRQPFLGLTFIIALQGVFPPRS
jgi:microcystin-dependent protein